MPAIIWGRIFTISNNERNKTMTKRTEIKKGDKVTYMQKVMFKGEIEVTATVVAVFERVVLLDTGVRISIF